MIKSTAANASARVAKPVVDEEFKPIPIRRSGGVAGRAAYALRQIVDLQLLTCSRFVRPRLARITGKTLDVGCGEMPFRGFLPAGADYTGLDIPAAEDFGMNRNPDIVDFDGLTIPFPDNSFDCVLCTEVLEHAEDPVALIAEMRRVLRKGGVLIATIPFSARVHHAPYDFHRFTRYRLLKMFNAFESTSVVERGNDFTVIANKMIVVCMRLAKNAARLRDLSLLGLLVFALPTLAALALAHVSLALSFGSRAAPLGYGVEAIKG